MEVSLIPGGGAKIPHAWQLNIHTHKKNRNNIVTNQYFKKLVHIKKKKALKKSKHPLRCIVKLIHKIVFLVSFLYLFFLFILFYFIYLSFFIFFLYFFLKQEGPTSVYLLILAPCLRDNESRKV